MESDHSEVVLLEELLERPRDPVNPVPRLVLSDVDVVVELVVVNPPKGFLPLLLLRLHVEKYVLDGAHRIERQCQERFLRLGGVVRYLDPFAVRDCFGCRVLNLVHRLK